MELKGFYQTDKSWIVSQAKDIFGVAICGTCHGELVKWYNKLQTYYLNEENMANKVSTKQNDGPVNEEPKNKYTLKDEYKGATHSDGKNAFILDEVLQSQVETIFSQKEIETYFEIFSPNI